MIRRIQASLILLGALCFGAAHAASGDDVAFVTQLSGRVMAEGKDARAVTPFSKLKVGDKLTLAPDARLQLVYFEGGRQETWSGAAVLTLDSLQSKLVSGNAPTVGKVSPLIAKQLLKAPGTEGVTRVGMVKTRNFVDPAKVAKIEEQYQALIKESSPGDAMPALYKLAALYDAKEKDALRTYIAELKQDNPGSSDVASMVAGYERWLADN